MNEFIKGIIELKIPTVILISLFLICGGNLILNAKDNSTIIFIGSGVLIVGIVFGIISFSDHRNKEHYESIIKALESALKVMGETHSTFENKAQTTMNNNENNTIGTKNNGYSLRNSSGTTGI